ncbi:MAG: cell wall hydrolase [Clostridia bacterium]|nr:cell wall hydrolase [Clostridia bacterium]
MKKLILLIAVAAMLACILIPGVSFTEDNDTIRLAKSIYALARTESYETKLAIGSVVMNRVEDPWFGDTLGEVLSEQHQFPSGSRYDAESLSAAHDVLSGKRVLSKSALYYRASDAAGEWNAEEVKTIGGYTFYSENGNR